MSDRPFKFPLVPVLIAVIAIAGGITVLRSALRANQGQNNSGPVRTPTREEFLASAGDAMRDQAWGQAETILEEAIGIYDQDQDLRLQLADVLRSRATAASWQREAQGVQGAGVVSATTEAERAEAETLARRQDSLDAYEQLVIALRIGPATPEVEFRAGLLASEIKDHDKAIEHFTAARTGAPTNSEYVLYLAQAQLAAGQRTAAKATLLACVNLDPENAIAWGTLADVFLQENKLDMAIDNVRKARALQPDVTLWRLIEARALKRRNDAEEALQLLIALPDADRHEPQVVDLVVECYAFLGRPMDAARAVGAASDFHPTNPTLALDAAQWFRRAGDAQTALRYASNAAMLGNPEAQALVSELGG